MRVEREFVRDLFLGAAVDHEGEHRLLAFGQAVVLPRRRGKAGEHGEHAAATRGFIGEPPASASSTALNTLRLGSPLSR